MTHPILRTIIAVSVSLSAWAEYSLFVSFAPEPDRWFNPVTLALGTLGGLFVVAQFALAAQAVQRWPEQQRLAGICAATCAVLLVISITGTATWFESAYQKQTTASAPAPVTAADQIAQEAALATLASAAELDAQADRLSASNLLTKAAEFRQQAATMRTAITLPDQTASAPAPVTQATIAGDQLGGLLFWAIAILTDLIPLLAVVLINTGTQATATGEPQHTAPSELAVNPEPVGQPTNPATNQPTNPVASNPEPAQPSGDALQTLRVHIRENGTMLTRAQAAELGIGQNQYRRACTTLKEQGVIQQPGPGKPYRVLNRLEAVQ